MAGVYSRTRVDPPSRADLLHGTLQDRTPSEPQASEESDTSDRNGSEDKLIYERAMNPFMAKKRSRRRRRFNLRQVRVTPELALATLASDTALVVGMTGVAVNSYRCRSIKGVWNKRLATAGEGPITVGFAHSDYSVTEIKECLETLNIDPGNKVAQERAKRLIRIVGTFGSNANEALNDGKPISTKLNWLITEAFQVNFFVFNDDTVALTTGSLVNFTGNMWVQDSV